MTRNNIAGLAYFFGLIAISAFSVPTFRFLSDIGWNVYIIAFAWMISVGCFCWSVARFLTADRFW